MLPGRVQSAAMVLGEAQAWLREVLFAGWLGGERREAWLDLLTALNSLCEEAAKAERLIMAHGPDLPDGRTPAEMATTLAFILDHIERHGNFGPLTRYVTHRGWHRLLQECRADGRAPQTMDEVRALLAQAQLQETRSRFLCRWRRAVERLGGPAVESLGSAPERAARAYAEEIRKRLEWRADVWEPVIEELRRYGFRWESWLAEHPPVPGDHGELTRVQRAGSQRLVEVVEARAARLRLCEFSGTLDTQRTYLAGFPRSDLATLLLRALDCWHVEAYAKTCRELARLEGLKETHASRLALLDQLKGTAPSWSHSIAQRQEPHHAKQPPGDPSAAWRWRQW